ncbi:ribonuclease HII [Campylobacterota bacterium]|nr:ribonuclease HII [Campylobacterota bacterium]
MKLCGIDEAGRGCLAGPLAIAGVVWINKIEGVDDSKKLSEKRRVELSEIIKQNALWHIEIFDAAAIDELGLSVCLAAGLRAIKSAIAADRYLYDGNCTFGVEAIETLVKADSLISEVSAASILAKTAKDARLYELGADYPQYGFERHKGYGTKDHLSAIAQFGLSSLHRKTFKIKRDL